MADHVNNCLLFPDTDLNIYSTVCLPTVTLEDYGMSCWKFTMDCNNNVHVSVKMTFIGPTEQLVVQWV